MKKCINAATILKFKDKLFESKEGSFWPTSPALFAIVLMGVTAALIQFNQSGTQKPHEEEVLNWDTFIPDGQSLVPIQVSNYESLDQIIGQFGVVDLLSTPLSPNEKAKRVAYAVKLIRSPKSPRHFSVLVPADKAPSLAGFNGEFTVVVRNPKLIGTKIVKDRAKSPKRRIFYETEDL